MKIIVPICGAIAGLVLSTIVCWGLLYFYGTVVLNGYGSLFDTDPQVANAFFITWGIVSLATALGSVVVAIRLAQRKHGKNRDEE